MNNIVTTPIGEHKSTTTVVENETATVGAAAVSKPEIVGVETKITRHAKHAVEIPDVNDHATPARVGDASVLTEAAVKTDQQRMAIGGEPEEVALIPLTEEEATDRERLIEVVRTGLDKARVAGQALSEINQRQLWKSTHRTFKAFCEEELDMSQQRFCQMIQWAEETASLQNLVSENLMPATERASRALSRVKKDNKVQVLTLASKLAGGGRPNSTTIEAARLEIEGAGSGKQKSEVIKVGTALEAAKTLKKFLASYDVDKLEVGELKEFRAVIAEITTEAQTLNTSEG